MRLDRYMQQRMNTLGDGGPSDAPMGEEGGVAYFDPWGNPVMVVGRIEQGGEEGASRYATSAGWIDPATLPAGQSAVLVVAPVETSPLAPEVAPNAPNAWANFAPVVEEAYAAVPLTSTYYSGTDSDTPLQSPHVESGLTVYSAPEIEDLQTAPEVVIRPVEVVAPYSPIPTVPTPPPAPVLYVPPPSFLSPTPTAPVYAPPPIAAPAPVIPIAAPVYTAPAPAPAPIYAAPTVTAPAPAPSYAPAPADPTGAPAPSPVYLAPAPASDPTGAPPPPVYVYAPPAPDAQVPSLPGYSDFDPYGNTPGGATGGQQQSRGGLGLLAALAAALTFLS
jgi:hypothetical protein